MANTNTNIVEWPDLVRRRPKTLTQLGQNTNDSAMKTKLYAGLLPEFEPYKIVIKEDATLTFNLASKKLYDHALDNNLVDLRKNSNSGAKNNTFSVSTDVEDCRNWAMHRCRHPNCKYNHDPSKGGPMTKKPKPAPTNRPAAAAQPAAAAISCDFCKSQKFNHLGHTAQLSSCAVESSSRRFDPLHVGTTP
jgi:hypothetical protein